jgi:hypothetical protein
MADPADRALTPIREQHTLAKAALMQAPLGHRRDVGPAVLRPRCHNRGIRPDEGHVVDRDGESQCTWIGAHDENWPRCHVTARQETIEINEWEVFGERAHKTDVISVCRIRASIPVVEQSGLGIERVVIRPFRCCRNRQRNVEHPRLEDALRRREQGYPRAIKLEALQKERARQHVSMDGLLLSEPVKCTKPNDSIEIHRREGLRRCQSTPRRPVIPVAIESNHE